MKIAHLQFTPVYGDVAASIAKVDALLQDAKPGDFDFLLLPELAFAGYNYASLTDIGPYLELCGSGPSCTWARVTAQRLHCIVGIGYAETTSAAPTTSLADISGGLDPQNNFNASTHYGPDGSLVAHYRKHFLFTTDETWCIEGSERFYDGDFPAPLSQHVAMGICMDINPYHSLAPWTDMEFANHALQSGASLVIVSMAWNSLELSPDEVLEGEKKALPDYATLEFWISRFTPLIEADKSVILVMGNRTGVEGDVIYSGSSIIGRVGNRRVEIWDVAGRGNDQLLLVDTETKPKFLWDYETRKLIANT